MTTEGVLESKSVFDKCCLELKNTLENMWGETNIWNFEVWPLSHRTLIYILKYTLYTMMFTVLYTILYTVICTMLYTDIRVDGWNGFCSKKN